MQTLEKTDYWTQRYIDNKTEWDTGSITTPMKAYIDHLRNRELRILIPGSGNSYEAEYLHSKGFVNVYICDISEIPLQNFMKRCPDFPKDHVIHGDFFDLDMTFDLILEQTFFCSLEKSYRDAYARKVAQLIAPNGKFSGVLFDRHFPKAGPPHGGTVVEYLEIFSPYFKTVRLEPCYNSIKPREGKEIFTILRHPFPERLADT